MTLDEDRVRQALSSLQEKRLARPGWRQYAIWNRLQGFGSVHEMEQTPRTAAGELHLQTVSSGSDVADVVRGTRAELRALHPTVLLLFVSSLAAR